MQEELLPPEDDPSSTFCLGALEANVAVTLPGLLPLANRFSVQQSGDGHLTYRYGLREARLRQRGPAVIVEVVDRPQSVDGAGPMLVLAALPAPKAVAALVAVALML